MYLGSLNTLELLRLKFNNTTPTGKKWGFSGTHILAKIQIYTLIIGELIFTLYSEIPCSNKDFHCAST
jgi:hypothetical protein